MHNRKIYTVGGTVQASGGRYITRAVDSELMQNCQNGEFSFVLTARQMGKSSLMVRTAQHLAQEGIRSVIVDLSQIGVQITEDSWYLGILTRIEDSLDLETDVYEWWNEHRQLGHGQRLTAFFEEIVLREVEGPLVVFMDEIDSTLSLPFTDDFFAAIRYIYNARASTPDFRRLSFVLIGVATPNDLISDPSRTPFNIGKQVEIDYFTSDEALPLAEGFDVEEDQGRRILSWILKWTNGHPFLTQRLSSTLADGDPSTVTESDLDHLVSETYFGDQSEHDSNLRFVHDMLTRRAEDPTAVLSTYRQIIKGKKVQDNRQSSDITHLKLSGIVGRQNGQLQVRNRIYATVFDDEWLNRQWPEHWLKRVPPAVLGLVAASFVTIILLGALFFQLQKTTQAEETANIQAQSNDSLQVQFDRTALLNQQLADNNQTLDSLRLQEADANSALSQQIGIAERARAQTQTANNQLSDQIVIAESLRTQTQLTNLDLQDQVQRGDSLSNIVQSRLDDAIAARLETLSLALANAARRQERQGNATLGALLARQAYHFSRKSEGRYLDPIYDALTSTLNAVTSTDPVQAGGPNVIGPLGTGIRSISSAGDASFFAAGLEDGQVVVLTHNGETLQVSSTFSAHRGAVRSVVIVPSTHQIISSGDDGRVIIWTDDDGGKYRSDELTSFSSPALALAVSGDGHLLASGSASGELNVWNVQTHGKLYERVLPNSSSIRTISFKPNSNTLAFGADDGRIRLLDENGNTISEWAADQGRLRTLAFHPSDETLASGGDETFVRRWSVSDDGIPSTIGDPLRGHEGPVNSIVFNSSGTRLASGSYDHSIQIWDLTDLSANSIILQSHSLWVETLAFTSDDQQIVSGGADRTVQIWNLDLETLASKVCSVISTAELTRTQWDDFIGSDFSFVTEYTPCSPTARASGNIP